MFTKLIRFIISWQFLVNLLLAILILVLIFIGTLKYINSYTNHGKEIEIPNIVNSTLKDGLKKLDDLNLKYEIDTSKYNPYIKPNQIEEIYPEARSMVKAGRTIYIKANAKSWIPVVLPDIINKSKYLAFNQLKLVGLNVVDTIYEPNPAEGTVLKVIYKGNEIQPHTSIPYNSPLTLVIAKEFKKNVIVPNILGKSLDEAKQIISSNLFSIGNIKYENKDDTENTIVYYQVPLNNSYYDEGKPIDIYLSSSTLEKLKPKIDSLNNVFNPTSVEQPTQDEKTQDGKDNTTEPKKPKRIILD